VAYRNRRADVNVVAFTLNEMEIDLAISLVPNPGRLGPRRKNWLRTSTGLSNFTKEAL